MFINDTDHFDQHFLIDEDTIKKFIDEANFNLNDIVVEIGPGKGNISKLIAQKVKKLYCIELDNNLAIYLDDLIKQYKNVEIIYDNALTTFIPKCNKIVTSLPYSIIEPFINKLIKCDFDEILMITGKKYADNVENMTLNKLSLITNCYFNMNRIIDIVPDSFLPKPRVMSSMIKLTPKKDTDINDFNLLVFRYLFYFKNKKTKNALVESLIRTYELDNIVLTQKQSKSIVNDLEIDEKLLEKNFENYSNEEIILLNEKIKTIKYEKK